jgi:hypothetical protein
MTTVVVFNSWDSTAHAMNGLDKDGDAIFCVTNEVLLKNTENTNAVICVQKPAPVSVITEDALVQSNKDSFGDDIGATTNKITSMVERQALFDEGSEEYRELDYRIKCGQMYQQNCIDKFKGIVSNPMPREWFDPIVNKVKEGDDEETIKRKKFNQRILADKKPYFMRYIYPRENYKYTSYLRKVDCKSRREFRMSLDDLLAMNHSDLTEEQVTFIEYYYKRFPLGMSGCTMNKICWLVEKEVGDHIVKMRFDNQRFDPVILKSEHTYSETDYRALAKLYEFFLVKSKQFVKTQKADYSNTDKEDVAIIRAAFIEEFKREAYTICNNKYELCNMLIDLCYSSNSSKQFCWDICGDVIIDNLLKKNDYVVNIPCRAEDGDINFGGETFRMHRVKLNETENLGDDI